LHGHYWYKEPREGAYAKFLGRLLGANLLMLRQHFIIPKKCVFPLFGWNTNCHKWPNVAWLAKQILTIHGNQIKTKQIFSIVGYEDVNLE
jgi:hypothetical protein